jgi:universal stress protein A
MASMFTKLLVPVDLTDRNTSAITVACDLAQQHGAEVILLHVIETLEVPFQELEDFYHKLEDEARERIAKVGDPLTAAAISWTAEIVYGKRAAEIVYFADQKGCDLIIIMSHRLTPDNAAKTWMSISHQVAILAQTAVLVLK